MFSHFLNIIVILNILNIGCSDACQNYIKDFTWLFDDTIDEVVPEIESLDLCGQECRNRRNCKGSDVKKIN